MSVQLIIIILVMAVAAGLWIIFTSPGIRPRKKIFVVSYKINHGLHCDAFLFWKEVDAEANVHFLKETRHQEMKRLGIRDARIVVLFIS